MNSLFIRHCLLNYNVTFREMTGRFFGRKFMHSSQRRFPVFTLYYVYRCDTVIPHMRDHSAPLRKMFSEEWVLCPSFSFNTVTYMCNIHMVKRCEALNCLLLVPKKRYNTNCSILGSPFSYVTIYQYYFKNIYLQ